MLETITTTRFKKDLDKAKKQGKSFSCLKTIMRLLAEEKQLESNYLDHPLKGKWKKYRECHIENDWLLIYRVVNEEKKFTLRD